MKQEIINFYAKKGLHIEKLIQKRDPGITPDQIKVAAAKVYYEIKNGLKLKPRMIGHRVHRLSKMVDVEKIAAWYRKKEKNVVEVDKSDKDVEITVKIKGLK